MVLIACFLAGCAPLEESRQRSVAVGDVASEELVLTPPKTTKATGASARAESGASGSDGAAEALTQEPAAGGSASRPSRFDAMLKGMSSVLRSAGSSGQSKLLVPDPTEPKPAGGTAGASGQTHVEVSVDSVAEPATGEVVSAPEGFAPITMNVVDQDVRLALEMLSREASVNIMVSEKVSGRVTANLRGLSFEEALDAILRLCDLVAHREGKNVFIYPAKDLPLLDRMWKVIPLDYVSAEEVVASIKQVTGLLSEAGSVYAFTLDDPTKAGTEDSAPSDNRKIREAIVVEDSPNHVFRIERYVEEVDVPPRQVQIQAYILEVVLKDNLQHGVNFEEIIKVAGNTATLQTIGLADPRATSAFFARIDGKNFDALLESLRTMTDAKTLADPKITVLNGQLAHIQIGEKLGYLDTTTQTSTAATQAVKFLELGVMLDVTPRITADGRVVMTVKPKVASGRINPETELPEEENTELTTNVMLEDGQGMVIGGLIKEKDSDIQNKIPLLGDLPYLGLLFQDRKKETERTEVIVAILPRVLPYAPCPAARDRLETIRATTPLFHGPLRRCPRPWEPSFRDALPRRGDLL